MTPKPDTATSASIARVASLLKLLKGHTLIGLTLTDLAKAIKSPPSTTLRTLQNMAASDLVTQLDSGRWALSIAMLQIAESHHREMSRASERMNNLIHRVEAGAHN